MDRLICPISLERFTHPIVLDCGHTLDKSSLEAVPDKRTCPVCSKPSLSTDRINWVVVSALKLGIDDSVNKANHYMTAKEAKEASTKCSTELVKKFTEEIFSLLLNESINKGEHALIIDLDAENVPIGSFLYQLIKDGYKIYYKENDQWEDISSRFIHTNGWYKIIWS